ncbi:hypothetical protein LWI28_024350 [Acer negundo]|uniref:carbamoyl-phosphate synthase (glutamine-hydrolyzing) n=1 Tax=Acer negundo TaxID=4023 RepID=A0AAD5IPL9_ACENE|nr:hypothetical protein LWI28_024350 [Acer negundo]
MPSFPDDEESRECFLAGLVIRGLVMRSWDIVASETLKRKPHGVLFSNGLGDPSAVPYAVETAKEILGKVPVFGICMGHQLLGQALGGKTFKMKFSHHGGNHPLFYLHTLQWDPPIVDKAVISVVFLTNVKIKKCVFWLHTEGGVGSIQISVEEFFKQPTQSNGQNNGAAHGETSQANQGPVTSNHAHMKGIADVLQLVKEIPSTMMTELDDIRTKVNFLYEKFSSAKDKNLDNNLHNTSNHHNSMHNIPPNPNPPLQSPRPISNPTSQQLTIEVSSNNTRTLPQHQQTISKSTPSWMKAPSETPLKDGNAPDLPMEDLCNDDPYYVPPVLTVPSLVEEDE